MIKRMIVVMLIMATFVAITEHTARADEPSTRFQASIGERTIDVSEGSIIVQGTMVHETVSSASNGGTINIAYCQVPRFRLSIQASGYGQAMARVNVNANCELELIKAESLPVSTTTLQLLNEEASQLASSTSGDNTVKIRGWAKSEWNDFAEIDLASAYGEVWFWVRGSSYIYDPHDVDGRCGWFAPSGWKKDSCKTSWGWTPNTKVWVKTVGEFHNPNCAFGTGQCSHKQWGKFTGTGWLEYTAVCESNPSNAVPGAHFECQGGQEHTTDNQ